MIKLAGALVSKFATDLESMGVKTEGLRIVLPRKQMQRLASMCLAEAMPGGMVHMDIRPYGTICLNTPAGQVRISADPEEGET